MRWDLRCNIKLQKKGVERKTLEWHTLWFSFFEGKDPEPKLSHWLAQEVHRPPWAPGQQGPCRSAHPERETRTLSLIWESWGSGSGFEMFSNGRRVIIGNQVLISGGGEAGRWARKREVGGFQKICDRGGKGDETLLQKLQVSFLCFRPFSWGPGIPTLCTLMTPWPLTLPSPLCPGIPTLCTLTAPWPQTLWRQSVGMSKALSAGVQALGPVSALITH